MNGEGASRDWLSRLRENEAGWNDPAFPDRAAAGESGPSRTRPAPPEPPADLVETSEARRRRRAARRAKRFALFVLALLAAAWILIGFAIALNPAVAMKFGPLISLAAVLSGPLVILGLIAMQLTGRKEAPAGNQARQHALYAQALADDAAQAAARLGDAHAQLMSHTREFASVADQSASAILGALQAMSAQTSQLEQGTATSLGTLTRLGEQITAMTEALPRLEDRLATLGETLARVGGDLGERHETLDQQLQATALIAEEARLQLRDAGAQLADQLGGLREGARHAGEELANLSELSSARIDLTLDRVKSVLESTQARIEAQNEALVTLAEQNRAGIERGSDESLARITEHCRKVEAILDALDRRVAGQAQRSNAWLESTAKGVSMLASEINALENTAAARAETLATTMTHLSDETRRLIEAIEGGQNGPDQLIKRAEALLLALDSGVRELDESLPGAIGRAEARLTALSERIRATGPAMDAVETAAANAAGQLRQSDALARSHADALSEALERSQAALATQKAQIEALAGAVSEAGEGMARLGESVGPQMVEALARVRETAEAAAKRAREAISGAIPQAIAELGEASSGAVEKAVTRTISDQLGQISAVADDAVKAAHRATDKLTRQMLTLTDASKELERTLAANAERIDGQDRELMAHHSARLIASLNERSIDVNKWLDKDVSEAEWTAYLKGDQGLFARRATRLVSGAEARHVHALYHEDADFREHVNRYVHDFEMLLRTVMATKDGGSLALTMVSSDIGKLYVALAQAIERLRTH